MNINLLSRGKGVLSISSSIFLEYQLFFGLIEVLRVELDFEGYRPLARTPDNVSGSEGGLGKRIYGHF